jgi:hypothetical protein
MRDKFTPPFRVPIDNIKLDIKNFRYYGEVSNQRESIAAMLNDPKSNIYNLAKDIAENGLTPDPIVLSKDESDEWLVREGNRRITALKILNNPSIVSNKSTRSRFSKIAKKYDGKIPDYVECISCDDENCILDYLDRLHTGEREGTGRINWSSENKSQFDMHLGKPAANALAIKVKGWAQKEGASLNEPYKITNLQRVLQNKNVQSKLKYSWDGKDITASLDQKTLMKILTVIAEKAGATKVEKVYTAPKQLGFVDKILKKLNIDPDSAETEPYVLNPDQYEGKKMVARGGRVPRKPSWDRKRLIPFKNTHVDIPEHPDNTKARNIFRELAKTVDVRESINAAAVLLRVFLEFSVERYLLLNGLQSKTLATNVRKAADHMMDEGKITNEYKNEILRICNDQNLFSARTLQRFVHSFDFSPDKQVLCTLWENIDKFIAKCWK